MTIVHAATGAITYSTAAATTSTCAYVSGINSGDMLIMVAGLKERATLNTGSITFDNTPTWTHSSTGSGGNYAAVGVNDQGNSYTRMAWKIADGTESGTEALSINNSSVTYTVMLRFTAARGWAMTGADSPSNWSGGKSTGGSFGLTIIGSGGSSYTTDDVIIVSFAYATDVGGGAMFDAPYDIFNPANVTVACSRITEFNSNVGEDIGGLLFYGVVTSNFGPWSSNLSPQATTVGSPTTHTRGGVLAFRIREAAEVLRVKPVSQAPAQTMRQAVHRASRW